MRYRDEVRDDGPMKTSRIILGAAATAGAAHLAATSAARKLDQQADRYQREELLHPVPGVAAWIERSDGTRLRSTQAGSGPAVVLAHGYALTSMSWNLVAEQLVSTGHRVITFDQRGHGESTIGSDGISSGIMAEDYGAVLDHYDVSDGVLVGHSMGAFVALKYLIDQPIHAGDHLRGAVLVSPIHGGLGRDPLGRARTKFMKYPLAATVLSNRIYGRVALSDAFGTPSPSMVEALQAEFGTADYAEIHPAIDMMVEEDLAPRLAEIELPVSVIIGSEDRISPPIQARLIASNLLHAELVWLDGRGHMLGWEAVDEIVRRVDERILVR